MKNHSTLPALLLLCLGLLAACAPSKQSKPVYASAIEMVYGAPTDSLLPDSIAALLVPTQAGVQSYQWKNHLVWYGVMENPDSLRQAIEHAVPGITVRLYEQPFYVYDRATDCNNAAIAPQWEHTLMTANLVADTVGQQEYMHYHATQTEQFPEVKQGFCKADFQQLLVFRNGRQLMLVISIPQGESLDELDPKTVEDNPRVVEWNKQMSKYQEGIAGTAPGETWVVFAPTFSN